VNAAVLHEATEGPELSPAMQKFCFRPFPYSEPPTCLECDGCGLEGDSGEGFWEQVPCFHCKGTGYEPEEVK
jgi:hypothetical protein